jgi:hypothetical protein
MRSWGPLVGCVGAFFFWLGRHAGAVQAGDRAIRADVVTAGRFELVSPRGKLLASLRASEQGGARLSFLDDKQSPTLELGISPGGEPALTVYDTKGRERVTATVKHDTAWLSLYGGPISPSINLTAGGVSAPGITIRDLAHGNVSISLDDRGEPVLSLSASRGGPRVQLSAHVGGPAISLAARGGPPRANWMLLQDGSPQISFLDENGFLRVTIGGLGSDPVITLVGTPPLQRTELRVLRDGTPGLTVADEAGKPKHTIFLDRDGNPRLWSAPRAAPK